MVPEVSTLKQFLNDVQIVFPLEGLIQVDQKRIEEPGQERLLILYQIVFLLRQYADLAGLFQSVLVAGHLVSDLIHLARITPADSLDMVIILN